MKNLEPFQIFQIYHGVFLHYTTTYDYQKYKGKTNYTNETFETRKDKYSYHNLSREFAHHTDEMLEYYFSWLFYRNPKWVTIKNIIYEQAAYQLEWSNYSNKHLDNFAKDMAKIDDIEPTYLFERLEYGDIHYQTILILNKFTNILIPMNDALAGMPVWDFKYKKLKKFQPFYEDHQPMNELMYKTYIKEKHVPISR